MHSGLYPVAPRNPFLVACAADRESVFRRFIAVLSAVAVLITVAAVPVSAATTPCRPGAGSPSCLVWTGRVTVVADGDTPFVDVYGDGTSTPTRIRLIGVQAMEQTVYHPDPKKRRGECHALAATARLEQLVKAGGGVVRMTAQHAASTSRGRPLRSIAVRINGRWHDVGLDLIRNGYALWLPIPDEWAWNPAYRLAAQQAARAGKRMYDTDTCGAGPNQSARVGLQVNYDAEGDDSVNVNGEWMRVVNNSSVSLPLAGWWVRDSGLRRYTFPAGTVAPARGSIYVHVGKGRATATDKYWGQSAPLFANPTFDERAIGDGGYLFDPRGDLRAWMLYPCVTACAIGLTV
jgi:endonuclease YncB( thermonuclease family)